MTPPVEGLPAQVATSLPATRPARLPAPAPGTRLSADVVVITRDSRGDLERSLGSIREAAAQAGAGVLFVDLGSSDSSRSYAARHASGAQGVWLDAQDGLADALMAAAACSSADVLVLVNPALKPLSSDGVTQLLSHLEEHPYAAAVAP